MERTSPTATEFRYGTSTTTTRRRLSVKDGIEIDRREIDKAKGGGRKREIETEKMTADR